MRSVILGIVGAFFGLPVSYYFQPEVVRAKVSLSQYVESLPEIFSDSSGQFTGPVILSIVICTIAGAIIGWFMDEAARKRDVQLGDSV